MKTPRLVVVDGMANALRLEIGDALMLKDDNRARER